MGETINEVRTKLWRGRNPFTGLPQRLYQLDEKGWGSHHPYLSEGVRQIRPRIIVEVGVWKGGSTIFMAKTQRELGLDAVVIAVDTWLGCMQHWENPDWFEDLNIGHGYPQLYYTFAANIVANKLEDYVVPVPMDSVNAREWVSNRGIAVDMIHIDGGHDYTSVMSDLTQWWQVLRPGGLFVGDDYDPAWPDVIRATDDFLAKNRHTQFQKLSGATGSKCAAIKA